MINHELQNYDYTEGIEFIGLMPAVMESCGKTVGGSDNSVRMFGVNALGNDQLETIDVQSYYSDEVEGGEKAVVAPNSEGQNSEGQNSEGNPNEGN